MRPLKVTPEELKVLLVEQIGLVDDAEFERARRMAARLGLPLERAIGDRSRIPPSFLLQQIAGAWGVGFVDLKVGDVDPRALRLVPEDYARRNLLVPIAATDRELRVAMWEPRNRQVLDELERRTRLTVVPLLAPEMTITRAQLLYRGDVRTMLEKTLADETTKVNTGRPGEDRSAIEILDRVLEYAAIKRASDIHVEPFELEALVRCRIDGVLQEVLSLPPAAMIPLVARIKVLSGVRIDERRLPQDGRFEANLSGYKMDLRVSTLPTHWGEKVVLRILSKDNVQIELESLGLGAADTEIVLRNLLRPHGMVLVTGPTGAGKSSTLYAMLTRIGAERQNVVNISTVEDPVEYTFPRVNQTSINPVAGVDFATGLRALLRQDPDVIMVGEIRDRETAEIAVRASLVGRLLLSTLHTNDSTGTVPRLLDMGIEPFLVASTLSLVVAQRLVRRICPNCRESVDADESVAAAIRQRPDFARTVEVLQRDGVLGQRAGDDPLAGLRVFRGKGCVPCAFSGFRGRLGLFEVFEVDDRIRPLIMERRDAASIRETAIAAGMKTMFQDGLGKVLLGETTLEEVFRVAV
jgi:type IV pilus assembly protein PilB